MPIYDKSTKGLMKEEMIGALGITKGSVFTKSQVMVWFKSNYPKIKKATIAAHLRILSINAPSRIHHNIHEDGSDDVFYQIDGGHFRLYDPATDPSPIYEKSALDSSDDDSDSEESQLEQNEFAYEKDLQNFLSKNLALIEPGLTLYEDDEITGIEFPAGNRNIDILAVSDEGDYVVIELKVSRGYDRVVGQLLRYMAWIRKNQAEPGQAVRGIIVAREISKDLILACSEINNVKLLEYELSVSVHPAQEADFCEST